MSRIIGEHPIRSTSRYEREHRGDASNRVMSEYRNDDVPNRLESATTDEQPWSEKQREGEVSREYEGEHR